MCNPLAVVLAGPPAPEQAAHCKRRVPNCFTNPVGSQAAISRDKSPMWRRIGMCHRFRYSGPAAILSKSFPGKIE